MRITEINTEADYHGEFCEWCEEDLISVNLYYDTANPWMPREQGNADCCTNCIERVIDQLGWDSTCVEAEVSTVPVPEFEIDDDGEVRWLTPA